MDTLDTRIRFERLFDAYGPLLTDKQRDAFSLHYHLDLSMGEIAERLSISRPAVADHLRRAQEFLVQCESRLGLVAREDSLVEGIRAAVEHLGQATDAEGTGKALKILIGLLPT